MFMQAASRAMWNVEIPNRNELPPLTAAVCIPTVNQSAHSHHIKNSSLLVILDSLCQRHHYLITLCSTFSFTNLLWRLSCDQSSIATFTCLCGWSVLYCILIYGYVSVYENSQIKVDNVEAGVTNQEIDNQVQIELWLLRWNFTMWNLLNPWFTSLVDQL